MPVETETKAGKIGKAAVEAALEKVEVVTLDEVRAAAAELASVLARVAPSAHMTAAKERFTDLVQFVHAHFGVGA